MISRIGPTLPLSKAAKMHGISVRTLKRWLARDLGYTFKSDGRNHVPVVDLETVVLRRVPQRSFRRPGRIALEGGLAEEMIWIVDPCCS